MNPKTVKIILAVLIVSMLAIYFIKQENTDKPAETTLNQQTTQATENTIQTTTPAVTPQSYATTTTISPDALPECLMMKTMCKRDRCYFGNAITRQNKKLCQQIIETELMEKCASKLETNATNENAVIEGQIFNTRYCEVYTNLTVEIRDETENKTIATLQTNITGEYGIEVTPNKDYGVYVTIGNQTIDQKKANLAKGEHIVDFALT